MRAPGDAFGGCAVAARRMIDMTYKVKLHIKDYCNYCSGYRCKDGAEQWDIDEMKDDDGHYCAALKRYINGGTVDKCVSEGRWPCC